MPHIKEHRDRMIWLWKPGIVPAQWDASLSTGIINAHPENDIKVLVENKNNKDIHTTIYSHEGGPVNFIPGDFIFARMTPDTLVGYGTVKEVFSQAAEADQVHPLCAVDWKLRGEWPVNFKGNVPVQLVRILKFQGQYPEALALAVNIQEQDPGNLAVKLERISILNLMGQWAIAEQEVLPIIEKHPAHTGVLRQYAHILQSKGDDSEAIRIYDSILNTHPGYHTIRADLAALLRKTHQWDKAEVQLCTILEADPGNLRGLKQLSALYRAKGNLDHCLEIGKKICALYPSDINAKCSLAHSLLKIEKLEEASALIMDLLKVVPEDIVVQRLYAIVLVKTNKINEALDVLAKVSSGRAPEMSTQILFMNTLMDAGQFARAEEIAEKVLAEDPSSIVALRTKIWVMEYAGQSHNVLTWLDSVAPDQIPKPYVVIVRQEFLSRHNAIVPALANIKRICEMHPEMTEALKAGASIARLAGHRALAARYSEMVLKQDPGNSHTAYQLATDYTHLYKYEKAVDALDKIHPLEPLSSLATVQKILIKASGRTIPESFDELYNKALHPGIPGKRLAQNARILISGGHAFSVLPFLEKIHGGRSDAIGNRITPMLAYAHFESGNYHEAQQLLKDYQSTPDDCQAAIETLTVLKALGKADQLRALFTDFVTNVENNVHILRAREMESVLRIAWSVGLSDLMHRLYTTAVGSPHQIHPDTVDHAARVMQAGQLSLADQIMEKAEGKMTKDEKAFWNIKKAVIRGHDREAIDLIGKRKIAQGGITIKEATAHIHALLRSENVEDAASQLETYVKQFPERDFIAFKAQVFRQNLEIERAIEYIEAYLSKDPSDEHIAHQLVMHMLNGPQPEKARNIITRWTQRRPMSPAWKLAEIKYCWQTSKDRNELVDLVQQILAELPSELRIHFYTSAEEALRTIHQFDAAYDMLEEFKHATTTYPSDSPTRLIRRLGHAAHLRLHGRYAEVRTVLSQMENSIIDGAVKNSLYVVQKDNAGCAGEDWRIVQDHVNNITTPRHRYAITDFTPYFNQPPPRIRVIALAHIYYTDLWPEIRPYLEEMRKTQAKICVSLSRQSSADGFEDMIRSDFQDARITYVDNRGFDVGAHWQVLEKTDLSKFDVAVLVQTKKAGHTGIGEDWRKNLLEAVAGSSERWIENLCTFREDQTVGIIGSGRHRNSADPWDYKEMRDVLEHLGMPTRFDALKSIYEHVSGTIFMIRASLLKDLFEKTNKTISFERYEDLCLGKLRDRTYAHAMERVFGMYSNWKGYRTLWRP